MALALVLLISFGLLFRSFLQVEAVSLGFDPSHVITVSAGLDQPRYSGPAARIALAKSVLQKALKVPGVQTASITDSLPLQGADGMWFVIEGRAASQGQQATLRTVASGLIWVWCAMKNAATWRPPPVATIALTINI